MEAMKEINTHKDGFGLNDLIQVFASDEDENGVPHRIEFHRRDDRETERAKYPTTLVGFLQFQHGPRNDPNSRPGLITDAVLAALIEIQNGFENGPYRSREGALVRTKLEEAAMWSKKRAKDRHERGVLGFNKP